MTNADQTSSLRPETLVVSAGRPHGVGQPINTPMDPASNFVSGSGDHREYSRQDGTDGWQAFEDAIGQLEGGEAISFASGMAAISAVLDLIPNNATILAPTDLYQGVAMVLEEGQQRLGWTVKRLAVSDTDAWLAALPTANFVWLESPTNPLLEVADIPQICAAAAAAGIPVAVDNTFATPLLQRPLTHGATFSVHSATKFIGGHSDLLSGVVVTAHGPSADAIRRRRTLGGATPGTLESFLALRGLRTLAIRLERSQDSALTLAERLVAHRVITKVRYPGLPNDPGHELARATMAGPGSVLSFEMTGSAIAADVRLSRLKLITPATSLGGVETTVERRAKLAGQEHIPPTLVRMSVGIEHVDDLWADLTQALDGLTS